MVTHSVCTTHSIIEIIILADNLQGPQVCGKIEAYVKPSNKRLIILLFYRFLTIWLLRFPHTSYLVLSERSIRIFTLFRSVRPWHIFHVRSFFAMWHEGLIVELCQIQSAWSFSGKCIHIFKKRIYSKLSTLNATVSKLTVALNTSQKSVELLADWWHPPMKVFIGSFLNHGLLIFPYFY